MNWIKQLLAKALENSGQRKIQLQFLGILLIVGLGIIGYQFHLKNLTLATTAIIITSILVVALLLFKKPILLKPILLVWLLIGLLLGEVTSTIILAFIFYFLFFPITFILRILNRKTDIQKPQWIVKESDTIDYDKLY